MNDMTAKSFEEFDKWLEGRGLSIEKTVDGWGQPRYLHPHIQSMFDGWNASRAALLADHDVAGLVAKINGYLNCDDEWPFNDVGDWLSLKGTLESLAAQNAALRERLEVADHGYDGIACRDETIRMQDKRIDELKAQVAERDAEIAREAERRNILYTQKIKHLEADYAKLKAHAERMYREIKSPQQDSELVADHYRSDYPKEAT